MTTFATYGRAGIRAPVTPSLAYAPARASGTPACASASSAGSTTVGLPWRFWITAERMPSTWPFGVELDRPAEEMRSVDVGLADRVRQRLRIGAAARA